MDFVGKSPRDSSDESVSKSTDHKQIGRHRITCTFCPKDDAMIRIKQIPRQEINDLRWNEDGKKVEPTLSRQACLTFPARNVDNSGELRGLPELASDMR